MAEVVVDMVEEILVRLDVEDLIRCKSVCKSWHSLISSRRFAKAHLKHAYKSDRENHELGHRRFSSHRIRSEDYWLYCNCYYIVGTCDGLVCVSPEDVDFILTNPSTRQEKQLPTPSFQPDPRKLGMIREVVCWGFGYDSSADDYKVVAGFMESIYKTSTLFHVLTLKSNSWRVIGQVKYSVTEGQSGTLCGGMLYWFMSDYHTDKMVIISLDLSTEEFKQIPLPDADAEYECDEDHRLGVIEECLCIHSYRFDLSRPWSTKKWVMKNNKWELYIDPSQISKYDIAYFFIQDENVYRHNGGIRVPSNGDYIRANIFVKSLVSPHHLHDEPNKSAKEDNESNAKGNIAKRKKNRNKSKSKSKRSRKRKKERECNTN